jgi:UDP-N-acetylglucosamine 4,6-dehydratase/5-epimerase
MMKRKMDWQPHSVLVTGGTGSFGRRFVEIMLQRYHPWKLVVFSRDEQKHHEMKLSGFDHPSISYMVGDVRDEERLKQCMAGITIVVHTAAMKHVPICELNPAEAIQTNVIGSQNVINAAKSQGVWRVLGLSSDKAVNPISLYGATKFCMEKSFVPANEHSLTRFSCVRYGNFLGSKGSVIPLFLEQRKQGRITLTDPSMTRFWMSLDKSVQFAISCIEAMCGGEIFVPKIPSMSMAEMAEAIAPGCKVENIGLRPGEKLHESLVSVEESKQTLSLDGMYLIQPIQSWWERSNWDQNQIIASGVSFDSETNPLRLTAEDLLEFTKEKESVPNA